MLFMGVLEAKIQEHIGFRVEGDLGRAMAMVEKADVWHVKANRSEKGQNNKNLEARDS